ncbi:MAG: YcxB family protein [Candidatus Acidiferrales bacterium]
MTADINLTFRYVQSDMVRAMRAHYASRLRLPLDIVVLVVLIVVGTYYLRSSGEQWLGITFLAIAAIFAVMLVAAFTIIPPLVFRREAKFRDEYLLTFAPEGIHFRTAHIDSQLQWDMYSRALVDRHSYVLYYGSRSFTVIPKRVFQSPEQQGEFERLLTQKVPQIVKKSR